MILTTVIADPRLQALYRHWTDRRRGRALPSRADIDPLQIPASVWPYTLLLDVLREDGHLRFRYRRTGEVFWRKQGIVEPRGRCVDEVLPETGGYRQFVQDLNCELVARRRPIYSETFLSLRGHASRMHVRRISLPLSKDGAEVDMVLVGHVFECDDERLSRDYALSLVDGVEQGVRILLDD